MRIIIKGSETREGVMFKLLENGKITFKEVPEKVYFYVEKGFDVSHFNQVFSNVTKIEEIDEAKYKIILENNFLRNKIRNYFEDLGIKTYEADINAVKRFLLTHQEIELFNIHNSKLFFDIETDDRTPLLKDEKDSVIANTAILSFSAIDSEGKEYREINKSKEEPTEKEYELLLKIREILRLYGITSGWNSQLFDDPYLEQRFKYHGIPFNNEFINRLDYMIVYKKNTRHSLRSYKLNAVGNYELKEGKLDQKKGNGEVYKRWKNDPSGLLDYNFQDALLLKKLDDKLGFIKIHEMIGDISHCFIKDTIWASDFGDYLVMNECSKRNLIMPSIPTKEEKEKRRWSAIKIGGGFTRCFKPGFYDEINVWDFSSAYPEFIKTFNISFDTFLGNVNDLSLEEVNEFKRKEYLFTPEDDSDGRYHPQRIFNNEFQGVIPTVVQGLLDTRNKIRRAETYKKIKENTPAADFKIHPLYLQQYSYKVAANSIFGLVAFPNTRFYNYHVADSITTSVRACIQMVYQKLEEELECVVLGGDTDSTFVDTRKSSFTKEQIDEKIAEYINIWVKQFNVKDHYIKMSWDKLMKPFFFVMKKNYAYKEGNSIVIKGLEAIKSSTNSLASEIQREIIEDIMNYQFSKQKWNEKITKIRNFCFEQKLYKEHLLMSKQLTKTPASYEGYIIDKKTKRPKIKNDGTLQEKTIPAHVKLAKELMLNDSTIGIGSKIRYIVKSQKPIEAINYDDWKSEDGYDTEYYWERIAKPIMKVLYAYDKEYFNSFDWKLRPSKTRKAIEKWNQGREDVI